MFKSKELTGQIWRREDMYKTLMELYGFCVSQFGEVPLTFHSGFVQCTNNVEQFDEFIEVW